MVFSNDNIGDLASRGWRRHQKLCPMEVLRATLLKSEEVPPTINISNPTINISNPTTNISNPTINISIPTINISPEPS